MLSLPPFSGTLTGSIPIATLSGRTLWTDGLIELNLFNGRIGVRGIEMDNLFSPTASFKSSIEIDSPRPGRAYPDLRVRPDKRRTHGLRPGPRHNGRPSCELRYTDGDN